MSATQLSPKGYNILTTNLVFNQLDQNETVLPVVAGSATVLDNPRLKLDGSGRAYLVGSVTLSHATPTAGMVIFNLPKIISISNDVVLPVTKKSGSTYSTTYIKLSFLNNGIVGTLLVAATQNDVIYLDNTMFFVNVY